MKGTMMKEKINSAKKFVQDNKTALTLASGAVLGACAMHVGVKFNANYIYISKNTMDQLKSAPDVLLKTPTWHGVVAFSAADVLK